MEITIIGWYGTETVGDRAILAGILKAISDSLGTCKINLGSLYPFFSERTIYEDSDFWKNILGITPNINLFDSKNIKELDNIINTSDLVIMGGGPLMQIEPLFMVRYAFKTAKKKGKKTAILGCGVGPLFSKSYKSCLLDIVDFSDLVIFRDTISKVNLENIEKSLDRKIEKDILTSLDPSVITCLGFLKKTDKLEKGGIAINLRKFPERYSKQSHEKQIDQNLCSLLSLISDKYPDRIIKLIPMHYFHIGNDDRDFLNFITSKVQRKNIFVQNQPLNLKETMSEFYKAETCYGMRFHSIVFQTLLNGNNYILDYTDPQTGKIAGFLKDIDKNGFYKNRYINLQENKFNESDIIENNKKFKLPSDLIHGKIQKYSEAIRRIS